MLLHYTTLCSCCQQHFGDGRCFRWLLRPCCLRASPRGAPPPTGGRGVGSCWLCCPTGHNAARSVRRGRHSGGPSAFTLVARGAAALSARVGFPLPDDFGRLWGFCGCRRDWAEPIGAARRSRGDARDKKGLDKIAKYREGVVAILASCMVNALAFFNAILQDLMQDAAFSFANRCKCVL